MANQKDFLLANVEDKMRLVNRTNQIKNTVFLPKG